ARGGPGGASAQGGPRGGDSRGGPARAPSQGGPVRAGAQARGCSGTSLGGAPPKIAAAGMPGPGAAPASGTAASGPPLPGTLEPGTEPFPAAPRLEAPLPARRAAAAVPAGPGAP